MQRSSEDDEGVQGSEDRMPALRCKHAELRVHRLLERVLQEPPGWSRFGGVCLALTRLYPQGWSLAILVNYMPFTFQSKHSNSNLHFVTLREIGGADAPPWRILGSAGEWHFYYAGR